MRSGLGAGWVTGCMAPAASRTVPRCQVFTRWDEHHGFACSLPAILGADLRGRASPASRSGQRDDRAAEAPTGQARSIHIAVGLCDLDKPINFGGRGFIVIAHRDM